MATPSNYQSIQPASSEARARRTLSTNVYTSSLILNPSKENFLGLREYADLRSDSAWEKLMQIYGPPDDWKAFVSEKLPILTWVPNYQSHWLLDDVIAGLTMAVMLVPQGVAYGVLAGAPAQYGLYACIYPAAVYAVLGNCPQLSLGPFGLISLMVRQQVESVVGPGQTFTQPYMDHVVVMSFLVGVILVALSMLKAGFVTIFISNTVIRAFTTGAAIGICTSQMKSLFQVDIPSYQDPYSIPRTYLYLITHLADTNMWALGLGAVGLAVLVTLKAMDESLRRALKVPVPAELLVIAAGIAAVYWLDLNGAYGVKTIGHIPPGLSWPALPALDQVDLTKMFGAALPVALVVFFTTAGIVQGFAAQFGYKASANQEMLAYGAANLIGSFFSCIPTAGSLSRSSLLADLNAHSPLPALVGTAFIVVTLYTLTAVFASVPQPVLAAVILVALRNQLLQHRDLVTLWRVSKSEFLVWVTTWALCILYGSTTGLLGGVVTSLLVIVFNISRPETACLGVIPGTDTYLNMDRITAAKPVPGCMIFRFSCSLYYANTSFFQAELLGNVARITDETGEQLRTVVMAMNSVNYIDYQGSQTLANTIAVLEDNNICAVLCGLQGHVRDDLKRLGFFKRADVSQVFADIQDAVAYHRTQNPELQA